MFLVRSSERLPGGVGSTTVPSPFSGQKGGLSSKALFGELFGALSAGHTACLSTVSGPG